LPPEFIEEVKRVISTNLPTSSSIIGEIIRTIADPTSNASDLSKIIEHDPPLTARFLQIANSAYYGASSTINSLQRAVVILGLDTIKELVMTTSVVQHMFDHDKDDGLDRLGLWVHSVGTAKAAQIISEDLRIERPDVTYTVGLLHDIGKVMLVLCFPDRYKSVVQLAKEKRTRIILAERKLLNVDHTMIGKILCDIWRIPNNITTAILYHHDPMDIQDGSQRLARIINLADYMCRKAEIGNPGDNKNVEPTSATFALLGKTQGKINVTYERIFQKLLDKKQEIEEYYTSLR